MNHYRCRDRFSVRDALIILALLVAVIVTLATCGQAGTVSNVSPRTVNDFTYILPQEGPKTDKQYLEPDKNGNLIWVDINRHEHDFPFREPTIKFEAEPITATSFMANLNTDKPMWITFPLRPNWWQRFWARILLGITYSED